MNQKGQSMAGAGLKIKEVFKKGGAKRIRLSELLPSRKSYAVLILVMAALGAAFLAMLALVNAFPVRMTMTMVFILFLLLILACVLLGRDKRAVRIAGLFIAVLFIAGYGLATYYLGTTYAAFARMSANNDKARTAGLDVAEDPFNVYITGIDMWNKEKGLDLERSDVNMIVTVCPETRKILLTSIPRDTYVMLHTAQQMDKLTHTGVYGVDETLNTVEDWLGIDMNYYVKVNFTSVVKIIYTIGGVDVESPKTFKSSISKYKYVKGMNHMDGRQALFFARERKAFKNEDAIRVENQQKVMKAMLDKLLTSSTLLTKYGDLLAVAEDDLETDMPMSDLQALVRMQLADLGAWDIETQKITGQYEMDYVASLTQEQKFQVYKPDAAVVTECRDRINAVMNPTDKDIREAMDKRKKASVISFLKRLAGGNSEEEDKE